MEVEHESSHGCIEEEGDLLQRSNKRVREEPASPLLVNKALWVDEYLKYSFDPHVLLRF